MSVVVPQWTEKLYPPSDGQDHLGLGSVSSTKILARLSPGIIVQSVHPRYWSFYLFLLTEFWDRDLPRTRKAYSAFYRPREAIYAIGAHLCDRPEHALGVGMRAVIGSEKASGIAQQALADYDPGVNYIKNDLGGYGMYYGGVIAGMDLALQTQPQIGVPFDTPTPEGRAGEAFRRAVADTTYYREYFADGTTHVPAAVLLDYMRSGCLCQLQLETASDRSIVQETFMHAGPRDEPDRRRATMRMLLDLAQQTDGSALTEDRYRQLIYFHADADGASWNPKPATLRTARQWRLYQAREYYSYALNRLWRYLAEWGQGRAADGDLVPAETWWSHVDDALDVNALAEQFNATTPDLSANSTLAELGDWLTGEARVDVNLDAGWHRDATITEHGLYSWTQRNADPAVIAGCLAILTLIAVRLGPHAEDEAYRDDWDICRDGGVDRLAVNRFLTQWRRNRMSAMTLGQAARWLIGDYVIRQHERVATGKLAQTGDTFRFRRVGDHLRVYSATTPAVMSSSRFQALATTVHELGLVGNLTGAVHPLTDIGQALLDIGDLPRLPPPVDEVAGRD
jgi:hypothetical protein